MIYFEDITVGETHKFGGYEVTREAVLAFAQKFDPQPFHLDDDAAAKTHFGRVAASGWHTTAMTMAMVVKNMQEHPQAGLGAAGVDELRWLKPVFPGDTLRCETRVLDKRASQKRPGMGSFRNQMTVYNQHDEPVMSFIALGLIRTRPAE